MNCVKCGINCDDDAYLCEEDNECFCGKCWENVSDKYEMSVDEEKSKMVIYANYTAQSRFVIPSEIKLLSNEENEKITGDKPIAWSWWVKWDTLYYYDENLKVCEIEPTFPVEADYKYPLDYTVDYE